MTDRAESGFTVVELVVVLALFSIVSVATLNFLDGTSRLTARTDRNAVAEADSQLALRIVTQNIRSAVPIGGPCTTTTDTASPPLPAGYRNCIRVTVSRNNSNGSSCARSEFVYAIVPATGGTKSLVENRQDFVGTSTCTASAPRLRRVLLTNVVNTATQPLLTYYRADGTAIDTAVTPAQVPLSASVKVSLRVRHTASADPLFFSSVAAPRNTR
ncbi:MAG: prepilin-type N-terminal cleavage/methylation domain-containing protein [Acidimicrobiales bacterium]